MLNISRIRFKPKIRRVDVNDSTHALLTVTDITLYMLSRLSICTPDADELKSSSDAHRDPVARHHPCIRLLFRNHEDDAHFQVLLDHHSRALRVKHAPVNIQAQKRILLHSAQRECGAAEFREGISFPPGGGMLLVDGAGGVVVMTPCWERAEEGGTKYYSTTL